MTNVLYNCNRLPPPTVVMILRDHGEHPDGDDMEIDAVAEDEGDDEMEEVEEDEGVVEARRARWTDQILENDIRDYIEEARKIGFHFSTEEAEYELDQHQRNIPLAIRALMERLLESGALPEGPPVGPAVFPAQGPLDSSDISTDLEQNLVSEFMARANWFGGARNAGNRPLAARVLGRYGWDVEQALQRWREDEDLEAGAGAVDLAGNLYEADDGGRLYDAMMDRDDVDDDGDWDDDGDDGIGDEVWEDGAVQNGEIKQEETAQKAGAGVAWFVSGRQKARATIRRAPLNSNTAPLGTAALASRAALAASAAAADRYNEEDFLPFIDSSRVTEGMFYDDIRRYNELVCMEEPWEVPRPFLVCPIPLVALTSCSAHLLQRPPLVALTSCSTHLS